MKRISMALLFVGVCAVSGKIPAAGESQAVLKKPTAPKSTAYFLWRSFLWRSFIRTAYAKGNEF